MRPGAARRRTVRENAGILGNLLDEFNFSPPKPPLGKLLLPPEPGICHGVKPQPLSIDPDFNDES